MAETLIHLVRHGEVENPDYIRYGQLPGFRLSEGGRAHVTRTARYLQEQGREIAALVSSPLERALETAEIIAGEMPCPPVETDPHLIEAASQFDGLRKTAFLSPRHWQRLKNPLVPSWAEPFADVARRMRAAIERYRDAHPGGVVILVSHQSPIWIARRMYESSAPPWLRPMRCAPASVTTLRFVNGRFTGHSYWRG